MDMGMFQMIITLLGGLALFIYGMNLMSDGLQRAAGEKMQKILALLTKNPVPLLHIAHKKNEILWYPFCLYSLEIFLPHYLMYAIVFFVSK